MKKIILGLFLTIGATSFALANNIENVVDKTENVQGKNFQTSKEEAFFGCRIRYVTRNYNCDRTYTEVTTYIEENGSCGSYPNGTQLISIHRTDGCPTGGKLTLGFETADTSFGG